MSITIASYRINLDALLARIVYRWRIQASIALLLFVAACGLASGAIPPFWQGRVALAVVAAPGATVSVDGGAWPRPLYAGQHMVAAASADGREAWAIVTLRAGEALTLTLPAGLPEPRELPLPPPAPGWRIDQVWWADDAWRIVSVPDQPTPPASESSSPRGPTPAPSPAETVAIGRRGAERLSTLDAYGGLADQVHLNDQLLEAVYRPQGRGGPAGLIEVRGWGDLAATIPVSSPLTLLRFAPGGSALLFAERIEPDGEQVYLAQRGRAPAPLVALPGRLARISWHPDGRAATLHSIAGARLSLTLVRLQAPAASALIADLDAGAYAGALVPLTWDAAGLLWVAPDTTHQPALWRASLEALIPERQRALDARAITSLPDGSLRVIAIVNNRVVVGRYQGDQFIGEATLRQTSPSADLAGIWQDSHVLLQGGGRAWLLQMPADDAPNAGREGA